MDTVPQLENLGQVDPDGLSLDEARELIRALLVLVAQLRAQHAVLKAEIAVLKAEIEGLQAETAPSNTRGGGGGFGEPKSSARRPKLPGKRRRRRNHSSERERREAEGRPVWKKAAKLATLPIHDTVLLTMDAAALPPDAVLVRHEPTVVQDLLLVPWNIRFARARYRSAGERKSYLTPLPPGYRGGFGPGLRVLSLALGYGANVSMPRLHWFLRQAGTSISRGQISRFLTEGLDAFIAEAQESMREAVRWDRWLALDQTRSGVRFVKHCCQVLGNSLAAYFVTTKRGDRSSVIEALFLGAPVVYRLDTLAFRSMEAWGIGLRCCRRLRGMADTAPTGSPQFEHWLDLRFPLLNDEKRQTILAAAALAGYHTQREAPIAQALLSDDAAVLRGLIDDHALCWVHDARHYQKLVPQFPFQVRELARFKQRYWRLYRRLLEYARHPTARESDRLEAAFDRLVHPRNSSPFLEECVSRTRGNREKLLVVLRHPELPQHNNQIELQVRTRGQKQKVSFGPVSQVGLQAWDTMHGLLGTTERLGVSFWAYLDDRIREGGKIPPLPELIAAKARSRTRPSSWAAP